MRVHVRAVLCNGVLDHDSNLMNALGSLPSAFFLAAFSANCYTFARIYHTVLNNQEMQFVLMRGSLLFGNICKRCPPHCPLPCLPCCACDCNLAHDVYVGALVSVTFGFVIAIDSVREYYESVTGTHFTPFRYALIH